MVSAQEVGTGSLPYFHCATTCSMLQAQLYEQQQRLLVDLQQLTLDPASVRDHALPSATNHLISSTTGSQLFTHSTPEFVGPPGEMQGLAQKAIDRSKVPLAAARKV